MRDFTSMCESREHARGERVSTTHVELPDGSFNRAASVGASISQAIAVAAFAQRLAGAEPPLQGDAQDAAAREAATSAVKSRAGGAEAPAMNACPSGGPHYWQEIDPRDRDTWGQTGVGCAECGKRRNA